MNLKGSRYLPNTMVSQINHELWQHHPDTLYKGIDPAFIKKIEEKDDPSSDYRSKIKGVHTDQLYHGILQYKRRQSKQGHEMAETKKDYREKLNGVLLELQKNQCQRKLYYKLCVNKQEQRRKRFIDDDLAKGTKVNEYVLKNYDPNVFHHGSDVYKQYQNQMHKNTMTIMNFQNYQKQQQKQLQKCIKNWQNEQRHQNQAHLKDIKVYESTVRKQNKQKYYLDLKKLVDQKNKPIIQEKSPKPQKHNPITNPIQYHIDNPYILKKIQNKYQK